VEDRVTVDFCPGCRGIWYDGGELEELLGQGLGPDTSPLPFGEEVDAGPLCPGCRGAHLRERTVDDGGPPLIALECPRCEGIWLDGGEFLRLRSRVRRHPADVAAPPTAVAHSVAAAGSAPIRPLLGQRFPFDSLVVNAVALPLAFVVALLFNLTSAKVLLYPFQIVIHELGHALTAWLSGRIAVPLPMGITFWGPPNLVVSLFVTALLATYGVLAWRERRLFAVGTALALFMLQFCLSWLIPRSASEMWITFGGIGGELLISAFVIVAFYYPAPDRVRWDFWRFVLLPPAASALVMQALLWEKAVTDSSVIPMGSALSASRDGSGDLEKLVQLYGWTIERIVESYRLLAFVCLVVIALHYLTFLARSWVAASASDVDSDASRGGRTKARAVTGDRLGS